MKLTLIKPKISHSQDNSYQEKAVMEPLALGFGKGVQGRKLKFYLKVMLIFYLGWLLAFEIVGYYASTQPARDFTTFLDQKIPLIPEFIWFYVSCYFLPVFFLIAKADWHRFNRMLLSFVIANLSAFLVYLIFPTTFSKPQIGRGLCEWILSLHYAADFQPVSNNMPSMHVTFAWLIYLAYRGQKTNRFIHHAIVLLAVMITISTLFVKQHVVVDVVMGLLWALWAWPVAKHLYPFLADPHSEADAALRQMGKYLAPFILSYLMFLLFAMGCTGLQKTTPSPLILYPGLFS